MHDNLTMPVLPKDTCSKYFKQIDISAGTWKCKCGKVLVQKKNTGWSNLLNHVKRPLESDKEDFAMDIIKKRRLGSTKKEEFMNTNFLFPTSNIIERFFSSATFAFDDHRQRLLPIHLEEQLFLKINNKFWDEKLVSGIC